jgi:hypothetical protein
MAAQEAYKYGLQERELGLKERQVSAQEKNVSPFAQGNYMSEAGPLVFNRETGGYTVNGEPYSEDKHGKATFAAKEDFRSSILKGSGAPAAPGSGKGKDDKKPLTEDEKRRIFNEGRATPDTSDAAQYAGESFGPNTPDAVLQVGIRAKDKQAIKEFERRNKAKTAKRESDAAIAEQGYGL